MKNIKPNLTPIQKLSVLSILGLIWVGTMASTSSSFVFKQNPTKAVWWKQNTVPSLPQPQENGDYRRSPHTTWEAVDPDPNGLNCRSIDLPYEQLINLENPITFDIVNWPIVGTLKQGEDFKINLGPAGFGVVYDTRQKPWIYVENTQGEAGPSHCFVRANRRFVKPVSVKAFNQN
ncbi:MAG: hypothetical protein SWJ54_08660 [Cyanobacteriota bacterium]|nr:hypothetical protein [Cyanobacteriota bacterium]